MASSSSPTPQGESTKAPPSSLKNDATVSATIRSSNSNTSTQMTIESSDVVRLIEAYLTENGLHDTCTKLRQESGIFGAGVSHGLFQHWARQGKWGTILDSLSTVDESYIMVKDEDTDNNGAADYLMADVHEMAILELGDVGEMELAYASLRLVADELDRCSSKRSSSDENDNALRIPRSRVLEQKLAALVSLRASSAGDEQRRIATPPDYYTSGAAVSSSTTTTISTTQQARREEIGKRLADSIPIVPSSRLVTLLQQSIKWQAYTGVLPTRIQQQLNEEEEGMEQDDKKKKKKKKHQKKRKRKEFNLVLGEVDVPSTVVGETKTTDEEKEAASMSYVAESIPYKVYSSIKFGKKATAESCLFLPDASGFVTGSSDGLIEIWDPSHKFAKLRLDDAVPYQQKDDFMWHDHPVLALALSNDGQMLASGDVEGTVKVWNMTSGTCLREFRHAHSKAISSICFSQDGSRILTGSHDTTCREFGLRTSRMLKEFRGHGSYVNTCLYHLDNDRLYVVTTSADGTIRIWDGKSAETLKVLLPRDGISSAIIDSSSAAGGNSGSGAGAGGDATSPSIHSLIPLHKVPNGFLVIPRGPKAYIITLEGTVMKTFDTGEGKCIVAATLSPSNLWFYAVTEDGMCFVFDVPSGKIEQTLPNFAAESTYNNGSSSGAEAAPPEISTIIHHPHKGMLAAFSNDKGQKRGILTLWK